MIGRYNKQFRIDVKRSFYCLFCNLSPRYLIPAGLLNMYIAARISTGKHFCITEIVSDTVFGDQLSLLSHNDHELQSSSFKGANYPKLRHEEAGRKKRVFSFSVEIMFWGPLHQPTRTRCSCLDCVKISNTTFLKISVRGASFKNSCWFRDGNNIRGRTLSVILFGFYSQ